MNPTGERSAGTVKNFTIRVWFGQHTEPAVYTCRVCSVENDDDLELRIPREIKCATRTVEILQFVCLVSTKTAAHIHTVSSCDDLKLGEYTTQDTFAYIKYKTETYHFSLILIFERKNSLFYISYTSWWYSLTSQGYVRVPALAYQCIPPRNDIFNF